MMTRNEFGIRIHQSDYYREKRGQEFSNKEEVEDGDQFMPCWCNISTTIKFCNIVAIDRQLQQENCSLVQALSQEKVEPIKRFKKFTTSMKIRHIPWKGKISNLATPIPTTICKTCKTKTREETLLHHDLHVFMRESRQHKTNGFDKEETLLSRLTSKDRCIQDECETLFKQADIHQPNPQDAHFVHNLFPW